MRPLWLLVACAALLPPVLARMARRRGRNVPRLSVVVQSIALVVVAGALAGVGLPFGPKAFKPCLLLRDVSGSTRGQSTAELPWPAGLERKTYKFAAGVDTFGGKVDQVGTHADIALKAAVAEAPRLSGVVIHTDGQFTDDWQSAAEALGRSGVDVTIVPMASPPPEVRIVDVSARRGAADLVIITVSLVANMPQERTLTVWRDQATDEPLMAGKRQLTGAMTIRLTDRLGQGEKGQYHVALTPPDAFPENDSASALVLPKSRQVAVVGREAGRKIALKMLEGIGAKVNWLLLDRMPNTEAGWSRYAGVVVVDATGLLLSAPRRKALAGYVRSGGGLVLIGACPHQTAADRNDPLSEVAALVANPYQRRPMKVTVVLDASGSMSELTAAGDGTRQKKFTVAADAVMAMKHHLTGSDSLAVMTFSNLPRDIYDSRDGPIDFQKLRDALGKVQPGGPTRAGSALARAANLPADKRRTELIILLSDLQAESFDVNAVHKLLTDGGKKLAIIATGSGAMDKSPKRDLVSLAFLQQIKPRHSENLVGLAEIFAAFLSEHRGSAVRTDGPFVVGGDEKPFGVDIAGIENLSSYVLSAAQLRAVVMMWAGDDKDALLAARPVGLGRSVTLSAELGGKGNTAWQVSPKASALVRAATEWCLRRSADARYEGTGVERGGKWIFTFEARDPKGEAINMLDLALHAELGTEGGQSNKVPLLQVAPGRYRAQLAKPAGAFLVTVQAAGKGQLWQGAYGRSPSPEFRAIGENSANLRRLARLTGGKIVSAQNIGDITGKWDRQQYTDIWPALASLALLLVLVDWVSTRMWKRWS